MKRSGSKSRHLARDTRGNHEASKRVIGAIPSARDELRPVRLDARAERRDEPDAGHHDAPARAVGRAQGGRC
jgi:hypothetical protein